MIEVIDRDSNHKMMAIILCGICYEDDCYLIYSIKRQKDDANLFVSKLIQNSRGYVLSSDFDNGEKEVLDGIVQRLLNREHKEGLERDGFSILKEVVLDDILYFDVNLCYVSSVPKSLIKDCLIFYGLVNEKMFHQSVVEVVEDRRKFNEGFVSNVVLIIFGIFLILFSVIVIYGVMFG